jgi:hypothetical protein
MMRWLGRGFWRAFRPLRESVAMRMMGTWDWVAWSSVLSKAVVSSEKMVERGAKGTAYFRRLSLSLYPIPHTPPPLFAPSVKYTAASTAVGIGRGGVEDLGSEES